MPDEVVTVNDLVLQHAAQNNQNTSGTNSEADKSKEVAEQQQQAATQSEQAVSTTQEQEAAQVAEVSRGTAPFSEEELKELGFNSIDDLRASLKRQKEETISPEEQQRRDNLYRVNLQKYAVEEGKMNPEEFNKLEALKDKSNRDIVFEAFVKEQKAEDPKLTEDEIKSAFEEEFPTYDESDEDDGEKNKARNKRIEKKIAKVVDSIKSPLESKVNSLKTEYNEHVSNIEKAREFNEKIPGLIEKAIPSKFDFYSTKDGDEEVKVDLELSTEDKKQISAAIKEKVLTLSTFGVYKKGDTQALESIVKNAVEEHLWSPTYRQKALEKMAQTFLDRGVKKGSNVGAENPFPMNQQQQQSSKMSGGDAAQIVLDSLQGKK